MARNEEKANVSDRIAAPSRRSRAPAPVIRPHSASPLPT